MVLTAAGKPLRLEKRALPVPGQGELLIEVAACAVCRTDLHVVDGELEGPRPIVPGHEVVGRIVALGPGATCFAVGDRVGVPWLGQTCGRCSYCREGAENLCDTPQFTGFTRDGGFATHIVADAGHCFAIPDSFMTTRSAVQFIFSSARMGTMSSHFQAGSTLRRRTKPCAHPASSPT